MKASSGSKAMSKGVLLKAIATEHDMKTKDCSNVLNSLVTLATSEVKKTGIFTLPGLCRIKTRTKPAKSMREDDFRQGDKVQGKASEDGCESLSSHCSQETDLEECRPTRRSTCQWVTHLGIPR